MKLMLNAGSLLSPDVYCNTTNGKILQHIYCHCLIGRRQISSDGKSNIRVSSLKKFCVQNQKIDFGTIMDIVPLKRGPSGRIVKLKIVGSKRNDNCGEGIGNPATGLSKSHLIPSA